MLLLGRVVIGVLLCTFSRGMATTEMSPSPSMTPVDTSVSTTSGPDMSSSTTPADSSSTTSGSDKSSSTVPADTSISTTSGPDKSSNTMPADTSISTTSGPDMTSSTMPADTSISTTSGPDMTSITMSVDSMSTTIGPEKSTTSPSRKSNYTTSGPDTSSSTIPVDSSSTTSGPVTDHTSSTSTSTNITPTVSTATPQPIIVCSSSNPCPAQSICLNATCQCLAGSYLLNGLCTQGQVFPGQLHLTKLVFEQEMSNRSSEIFKNTAAQISDTLRNVLQKQQGYVRTDVLQLLPGSVLATVNNVFEESSTNETSVDQAIQSAIRSANGENVLTGATFNGTDLCKQSPEPCDIITTTCSVKDGRAICSCRQGYISNGLYSNTSCRACPSGQQAVGGTCQACPFGYGGFNCNDSALLAVVVISCTLGGILLLLFLALLLYCCIRRCTDDERSIDNSPYSVDDRPWPVQGITPIPRATTNPNWDPSPSIEMREGGSTHALVDKKNNTNGLSGSYDLNPEGMKTFKGKNPSRYSYLVQGHENPYFLGGEDKKN